MDNRQIDRELEQAAREAQRVDPALLARISERLTASLAPVRPLAPGWVLAARLSVAVLVLAFLGAAALGLHGVHVLSGVQAASIFSMLILFTWSCGFVSSAEMTPGSRRRLSPQSLVAIIVVAIATLFVLQFHDYRTEGFVIHGVACLIAGLIQAIPAAVAVFLILRRGFAVDHGAAGLAIGTLAGVAGVTMLELHCPNLETFHVMVWHTAVIPLAAVAGWIVHRRPRAGNLRLG